MKKMRYAFALILILASSFVWASISISEPLDVYNLGDILYIKLDGLIGAEVGNLNIDLNCGNRTINLVKISARAFSLDESQSYSTDVILNSEDLEVLNLSDVIGECQVVSSLGTNFASTKTFTISNNIDVILSLDKPSYDPGEAITVSIEAVKSNGDLLSGFLEGTNATSFSKAVENGFVSEIFTMPETIESGAYNLNIHTYDLKQNKGSASISFNINQVASLIIMSLSNTEVMPGEDFTIGVEVFDQAGIEMEGTVFMKIISPENEEVESAVQSGEFNTFNFVSNSSVGTWRAVGSFNNVVEEREFEMLGIQKVEFEIEDSILSITNVGNILYNKTINVQVGNETIELDLNIEEGEIRKFNIGAPNGEYEVMIDDGDNSISRQVLLTGNAVSISDFKNVGIFKAYSIVWIFLIIVLGGTGVVFFMRYRKTKTVEGDGIVKRIIKKFRRVENRLPIDSIYPKLRDAKATIKSHMGDSLNLTDKSPAVQGLDSKNYSHEDKSMVDLTKRSTGNAESSLVLKGEKYMSAIVALSVKNYDNLSEVAKKALHEIVHEEQKNKGVVDWRDDYIFIVFSPIVTKTYNNEILATKTGMAILNKLNIYNKKFKDKIEFNLGVHVGELITAKVDGKLKYTSIGNAISLAKRISDSDSKKLIVSDAIRKKLIRDLKVDKGKDISGNQVYEVFEIRDMSANAAKLKDLMKRME
ncbi:MAG: hypothetical protein ABIF18_01445 [archaeon]